MSLKAVFFEDMAFFVCVNCSQEALETAASVVSKKALILIEGDADFTARTLGLLRAGRRVESRRLTRFHGPTPAAERLRRAGSWGDFRRD